MNKFIELLALNKDFEIIGILQYYNLQWRRKYYEAGTFSVQIPYDQYTSDIKYVYTADRPEVGEVNQINYIEKSGSRTLALSGYFLEGELNRRIVYELGTGNITNAPTWTSQAGAAEDVATAYFNAFKDVNYTYNNKAVECPLGIDAQASQGRGHKSDHERGGEYLGTKIYTILKPSEMAYRVNYDFINNKKTFQCIKGKDLTQDNTEGNNPVYFSTVFGNLKNPNIVWSDSAYKNGYIVSASYTDNDVDKVAVQANTEPADEDTDTRFIKVRGSATRDDYDTEALYIAALHAEGHEDLITNKRTMSFDFDAITGSYEYGEDFDLGDKCSLSVPEIGVNTAAVLSSCEEVIKKGTWSLTLEFDV